MRRSSDKVSKLVLDLISNSSAPMETKEIELLLKDVTRTKILYRLHYLRGEGEIKGKQVGSGKGAWIWWRKDAFQ